MSFTVCATATSTDGALSTSADLRLVLGATSTANDAYQQAVVARASAWAKSYLGYPVLTQTYSERVPAFGTPRLLLANAPVRAVLRVFDSTSTGSATEYTSTEIWVEQAEAGTLTRPTGFDWTARGAAGTMAEGVSPMSETEPWYVEYQAGYVFPETSSTDYGTTSTGRTLPYDIEQAVLLKAARMVVDGQSVGIASKKVGDLSITYDSGSRGGGTNTRSESEELLAPHRRLI